MMQINVLTPDLEIFKGNITSVQVPGVSGRFQVLKNHAPIVNSELKATFCLAVSPIGFWVSINATELK